MRVLFITPWYPTESRPAYGVYVREHAKAAGQAVNVCVLHLDGHSRPKRGLIAFEEESTPELTEGLPTFRVRWKLAPHPLPRLPLRLLATVLAYRRIRRDFQPDLIHAQTYSAGLVATLIGRATRIPVVITEHSTVFAHDRLPWRTRLEASLAFRFAHKVLPVSKYLLNDLRRWNLPGDYQVVPNVVDTQIFYPVARIPGPGQRLVFVGALRNQHGKGLPDLLGAMTLLKDRGLSVKLDVLGDGPKRRELEELSLEEGNADATTFHGAVSKRRVAEVVRNADLLVMPSNNCIETFCCPVAEAQAAGVPTVATTVGAIPETLRVGAGLLVPPGDPAALAEAISEALTGVDWDPQHIASGAAEFSAPAVGSTLFEIYRRAVDDPSS